MLDEDRLGNRHWVSEQLCNVPAVSIPPSFQHTKESRTVLMLAYITNPTKRKLLSQHHKAKPKYKPAS